MFTFLLMLTIFCASFILTMVGLGGGLVMAEVNLSISPWSLISTALIAGLVLLPLFGTGPTLALLATALLAGASVAQAGSAPIAAMSLRLTAMAR